MKFSLKTFFLPYLLNSTAILNSTFDSSEVFFFKSKKFLSRCYSCMNYFLKLNMHSSDLNEVSAVLFPASQIRKAK